MMARPSAWSGVKTLYHRATSWCRSHAHALVNAGILGGVVLNGALAWYTFGPGRIRTTPPAEPAPIVREYAPQTLDTLVEGAPGSDHALSAQHRPGSRSSPALPFYLVGAFELGTLALMGANLYSKRRRASPALPPAYPDASDALPGPARPMIETAAPPVLTELAAASRSGPDDGPDLDGRVGKEAPHCTHSAYYKSRETYDTAVGGGAYGKPMRSEAFSASSPASSDPLAAGRAATDLPVSILPERPAHGASSLDELVRTYNAAPRYRVRTIAANYGSSEEVMARKLEQARGGGHTLRYSASYAKQLSEGTLQGIVELYRANHTQEALSLIERRYRLSLSVGSLYAALDLAAERLGYSEPIRKRRHRSPYQELHAA